LHIVLAVGVVAFLFKIDDFVDVIVIFALCPFEAKIPMWEFIDFEGCFH
jgi:hypothetical protein